MSNRTDETWHRLREWTYGQTPSERLAAQILLQEGYQNLDPSHPLGGRDGGKDAVCMKDGCKWIMAVYFPKGQRLFKEIKEKFSDDYQGVAKNGAQAIVFVTNQEITLEERRKLKTVANPNSIEVEIYHLERLSMILDKPSMELIRKQFLNIDTSDTLLTDIKTDLIRAQQHLEAVLTGGDTFCYCMLYDFDVKKAIAKNFVVIRKGNYCLYDVRFRIVDVYTNKKLVEKTWGELNSGADFLILDWQLQDDVYYRIFFHARNGSWNQDLVLKKSLAANCWLAATRVFSKDGSSVVFEHADSEFVPEFGNPLWLN